MKRTLLLGTAWTASAAAAVGLGFLAISLVDASASSGGQTLAAALTTSAPAASSTTSSSSPSSAAGSASGLPGSPSAAPAGQQVTDGGTVYGSCGADGVPLVASAPAAGWWLDDSDDSDHATEVEFENGTQKIEVHVRCVDGVAQFSVEGPRSDDSGHGRDDSDGRQGGGHGSDDGVATTPAATTHSGGDDSDGRVGGGHGSDDGPGDDRGGDRRGGDDHGGDDRGGDDSSGRHGGGHGSDD